MKTHIYKQESGKRLRHKSPRWYKCGVTWYDPFSFTIMYNTYWTCKAATESVKRRPCLGFVGLSYRFVHLRSQWMCPVSRSRCEPNSATVANRMGFKRLRPKKLELQWEDVSPQGQWSIRTWRLLRLLRYEHQAAKA